MSKFLSSITPNDMPLSKMRFLFARRDVYSQFSASSVYCILELLRDAFQSKVSAMQIILEVNDETTSEMSNATRN